MKSRRSGTAQEKRNCWQEHIQAWKQGGLSQVDFCKAKGLALSTFQYWRKKMDQESHHPPRFYPVTVMPEPQTDDKVVCVGLRLILGERRFLLEIGDNFSDQALKRLILTLEQL